MLETQQRAIGNPALNPSAMTSNTANEGRYDFAQRATPHPQQPIVAQGHRHAAVSSAETSESDGDGLDEMSVEFLNFAKEQWRKRKGKSNEFPQSSSQEQPALAKTGTNPADILEGNSNLLANNTNDLPFQSSSQDAPAPAETGSDPAGILGDSDLLGDDLGGLSLPGVSILLRLCRDSAC